MTIRYDAGFDTRWRNHPKPQVTTLSTWLDKCGPPPEDLRDCTVLDVGCGCGRNSKLLADAGAIVTGVDSSPAAIRAAKENCPGARFLQMDVLRDDLSICDAPNSLGKFDFVFSHGVLHHTGATRAAFMNASKAVRRGGQYSVWVYCPPADTERVLLHMDMLHEITRAVDPAVLHTICNKYATRIRDANEGAWDPLAQVLRVSQSTDDDECVSDTFDWHCPQYRDYVDPMELCLWFDEAGFHLNSTGFPSSAIGVKR